MADELDEAGAEEGEEEGEKEEEEEVYLFFFVLFILFDLEIFYISMVRILTGFSIAFSSYGYVHTILRPFTRTFKYLSENITQWVETLRGTPFIRGVHTYFTNLLRRNSHFSKY